MSISATLLFLSVLAFISGLIFIVKEKKKYVNRLHELPTRKKNITRLFTFVAAIFLLGSFWAYKPVITGSSQVPFVTPAPPGKNKVTYTYYFDDNPDQFLTNVHVTIPEEYGTIKLIRIASEIKQKKWPSEHLEITFRIKGDSLTKSVNYAQASYYSEDIRKTMSLTQVDLNNIPVKVEVDNLYDSDSTYYYRDHPEKQ
jgi:hypothetical protein